MSNETSKRFWWSIIGILIIVISVFHYRTSTSAEQFHLIYMQSYFVPILIAAFQFGIRGGVGTALVISIIYFPHIMLDWSGSSQHVILRFIQIVMFNVIGFITGLKAQEEQDEKRRYQAAAGQLETSLRDLEKKSRELADLEEQLRLSDRLAIVGELTASLAHELRNPLATILGTVEILQDELPAAERQSEFFRILIQETERVGAVVDNYLNFTAPQRPIQAQFDVQQIIRDTCLIMEGRARKDRVKIRPGLPEAPIRLTGNPNDLRQILVNLLLNAVQAMPDGGEIFISAGLESAEERAAGATVAADGRCLKIAVRDQGVGIPEEDLDRVFQPFYTTKTHGTGLGLSIVKRIVDQRHWHIEVKSAKGEGTEFILMIPLPPPPAANETETETATSHPQRSTTDS